MSPFNAKSHGKVVPDEGIEPPTFGLQIRPEVVDPKRIIADYWFADKPLRDMIVDVR
ncbi:hypothetical protein [Xanthobacter versatilis]|uniref:hypothetical protein n=1 Tax=Xanthobacter autotrophicus (strain ATCC BAA-1158 / Py2) TaxID=78245 RepID=UPI003727BD9B